MTTARKHTPTPSLDYLEALRSTFSIETARQIVERVGLPPLLDEDEYSPEIEALSADRLFAQLAHDLNGRAFDWGWRQRQQTSVTPAQRGERAKKIAAKCAELLGLLLDDDGKIYASLGGGGLFAQAALDGADSGHDAVAESIAAVERLQRWATATATRDTSSTRDTSPEPARRSDEALNALVADLGGVFARYWRRAPGLSRRSIGDPSPGGPFFRFVAAVFDELDLPKTDEAKASLISKNPNLKGLARLVRGEWQ